MEGVKEYSNISIELLGKHDKVRARCEEVKCKKITPMTLLKATEYCQKHKISQRNLALISQIGRVKIWQMFHGKAVITLPFKRVMFELLNIDIQAERYSAGCLLADIKHKKQITIEEFKQWRRENNFTWDYIDQAMGRANTYGSTASRFCKYYPTKTSQSVIDSFNIKLYNAFGFVIK